MMIKVKKAPGLNLFFSFYFLFFYSWLQFHHGHEAIDYLNLGASASRVVIVGAHHHHSQADFPLFGDHEIVTRTRVDCLLCTFNDWFFLRYQGNGIVSILKVQKLDNSPTELVFHRQSPCTYRLRAPPVMFPAMCINTSGLI